MARPAATLSYTVFTVCVLDSVAAAIVAVAPFFLQSPLTICLYDMNRVADVSFLSDLAEAGLSTAQHSTAQHSTAQHRCVNIDWPQWRKLNNLKHKQPTN